MNYNSNKIELNNNGYSLISNIYSIQEVNKILSLIEIIDGNNSSLVKTKDLFAIRQLLKVKPELSELLFNKNLIQLLNTLFSTKYFLTKAIYFDKPSNSNWFVPYHQDLSISVDQKVELEGYTNWTFKKNQHGVHPPVKILENTVTIRIHLDDTTKNNGALKVSPKSHLKGIIRKESKDWNTSNEFICEVERGGVMLMKPLTLHASSRSKNKTSRRVIHLEFNTQQLEKPLKWLEYFIHI